jgi:hypothetical protein
MALRLARTRLHAWITGDLQAVVIVLQRAPCSRNNGVRSSMSASATRPESSTSRDIAKPVPWSAGASR